MKLSQLKTFDEVIEAQRQDPEFRAEWDRNVVARAVANRVLAYRTERGLSQRDLAQLVGMAQSAIARIESGEHQPSFDTLVRLTARTGLAFHIDVAGGAVELAA